MTNKAGKGSAFERLIATRLSLWWTQDETDGPKEDIFWRTSTSGARATSRHKKKLRTRNQHGDLCAIDPIGQPLLDLVTIEIKRGYNKATVQDLLDATDHAAEQTYTEWFRKSEKSRKAAGSRYWLVIVRRNGREATVFMPELLWNELKGNERYPPVPSIIIQAEIGIREETIFGMRLDAFLKLVIPTDIKRVLRKLVS